MFLSVVLSDQREFARYSLLTVALLIMAGQAVRLEEGESPGRNVPAHIRQ